MRFLRYLIVPSLAYLVLAVPANAQNSFGFSAGLVMSEDEGFYVDDPCDCWLDRDMGFVIGAQYFRRISPSFRVGVYGELESIATTIEDGMRFGSGVSWVGRTRDLARGPALELGGSLGLSYASLGEFDAQFGPDFSIFVGPAFSLGSGVQAAFHLVGLYGWYGGGDVPEGVQNSQLRMRVQVYGGER